MVIGLIRPVGSKPAGALISSGSRNWHGSGNTSQTSDAGSSKDPVVRLSQMLGQTSLAAEQQHSLKKCLEMAKSGALVAFDRVGFLESLTVCLDEARALQKHQERRTVAVEAFTSALLQHHTTVATDKEQQQISAARAQLDSELSTIEVAAVQQVRAAAAAAAARRQSAGDGAPREQDLAAEAGLVAFKAELQHVEDDWADVAEAQKACKEAIARHLQVFKAKTAPSSSSIRASICNPAALLFKGHLETHAHQVLTAVKHRAAALQCDSKQASATSHAPSADIPRRTAATAAAAAAALTADSWWHQQSSSDHKEMLQQAHGQRAERVEADRKQLLDAVQHAVQLMQQQVTQLEDKGWENAYMAGKLVEEVCIKAHAEFLNLATRQHSFAPDSADYLQQLAQLEAALSSSKEQFLDKVQAAATRIATSATAAML